MGVHSNGSLLQYRTRSHLGCAEGKRMLGTCTMGVDDMCTPFANWYITRVLLSTYVSAIHVDKSGRDLKPPVRSLRLRFHNLLAQESHTTHRNAKGNLLQQRGYQNWECFYHHSGGLRPPCTPCKQLPCPPTLALTIGKRGRNRGFQLFYGTTQSEPSWQAHTSSFSPEARHYS
jgi:hypothetical protein